MDHNKNASNLEYRLWWNVLGGSFLLLTILVCLYPFKASPVPSPLPMDKIIHFIIYFFHGLWFGSLNFYRKKIKIFTSLFFFSLMIELIQENLTSSRSFELYDLLANSLGLLLALNSEWPIISFIENRIRRR